MHINLIKNILGGKVMKKGLRFVGLVGLFLLVGSSALIAAEATASPEAIGFMSWCAMAAGIGMAIASVGTAIGQGFGVRGACEGISRNPDASGKILTALILGLAMIESLAIYALVIELILLYANPFLKFIVGA
jgi:F-type H+-transporting ATPase subunit c